VLNTFPPRNQPPDPNSLKGFFSLFPFPKIKVESSKIKGSKPINRLIPENHEHRNGDFTGEFFLSGLRLTCLYLYLCFLLFIPCKYMPKCLFFEREWWDKLYTRAWEKYKIGRGKIIVTYQEHSWVLFTCDITLLGEGLTKVVVLLTWAFVLTLLLSMRVSVEAVDFSNP